MNDLLKFITCGSVDDGKSTLIGHLLYDAKLIYADQKEALLLDSKIGSRGGAIDYSLLLDGLLAEREQGITIDVAYRYFTTDRRSFICADTPGHEEYTRNMGLRRVIRGSRHHPRGRFEGRAHADAPPRAHLRAHGHPLFRLCRE
jgi:sulfate adenylyltransferase subunit 1 (EFTu-like GTPase family)